MTNRELNDLIDADVLSDEELAEGEFLPNSPRHVADYVDPRNLPVDQ